MHALQDLPAELHQYLRPYLGYLEICSLRGTCRILRQNISEQTVDDLRDAELDFPRWEHTKRFWPCYECVRARPEDCFKDSSRKTPKGRNGKNCTARFCIECGVKANHTGPGGGVRYHKGQSLIVMKKELIVCPECGLIKRRGIFHGVLARMCSDCYAPIVAFKRGLQEREREAKEEEKRAERILGRAEKRKRRLELWGSDYSSLIEDDIEERETWYDHHMRLVQADSYSMNSPKPGSE